MLRKILQILTGIIAHPIIIVNRAEETSSVTTVTASEVTETTSLPTETTSGASPSYTVPTGTALPPIFVQKEMLISKN